MMFLMPIAIYAYIARNAARETLNRVVVACWPKTRPIDHL
jgi:hypothetical protein